MSELVLIFVAILWIGILFKPNLWAERNYSLQVRTIFIQLVTLFSFIKVFFFINKMFFREVFKCDFYEWNERFFSAACKRNNPWIYFDNTLSVLLSKFHCLNRPKLFNEIE